MTHQNSLLYRSGDAFAPEHIRKQLFEYIIGGPNTLFYLNYWSIIHMLSGILVAAILHKIYGTASGFNYYFAGFLIHTLWETWQMLIGMSIYKGVHALRQWIDTGVDTLMFMSGMFIYSFIVGRSAGKVRKNIAI
jgi:hypothetical protein